MRQNPCGKSRRRGCISASLPKEGFSWTLTLVADSEGGMGLRTSTQRQMTGLHNTVTGGGGMRHFCRATAGHNSMALKSATLPQTIPVAAVKCTLLQYRWQSAAIRLRSIEIFFLTQTLCCRKCETQSSLRALLHLGTLAKSMAQHQSLQHIPALPDDASGPERQLRKTEGQAAAKEQAAQRTIVHESLPSARHISQNTTKFDGDVVLSRSMTGKGLQI